MKQHSGLINPSGSDYFRSSGDPEQPIVDEFLVYFPSSQRRQSIENKSVISIFPYHSNPSWELYQPDDVFNKELTVTDLGIEFPNNKKRYPITTPTLVDCLTLHNINYFYYAGDCALDFENRLQRSMQDNPRILNIFNAIQDHFVDYFEVGENPKRAYFYLLDTLRNEDLANVLNNIKGESSKEEDVLYGELLRLIFTSSKLISELNNNKCDTEMFNGVFKTYLVSSKTLCDIEPENAIKFFKDNWDYMIDMCLYLYASAFKDRKATKTLEMTILRLHFECMAMELEDKNSKLYDNIQI